MRAASPGTCATTSSARRWKSCPSGGTFRYIGGEYPIVLMEELLERYGIALGYRFVESDADHVVIDLTLD